MAPRLFTRILLLSAIYFALVFSALAQRQTGQSDDVVRVSTDLVQTDFMVFDKQGNFVDGLKREQFVLKVDGKTREISFFDRVAAGSRNEEAQLAAARGKTGTGNTSPVPLDRGRIVVFFLDDLHLSPSSVSLTRTTLTRFIENEMRQNDQAAIASASGQLGFLQQVTENKAVLRTALDRFRSQQSIAQSFERPPMSQYQALLIEQHDDDVMNFFVDALIKEDPMLPRQSAANMVLARASQILQDSSSISTRTLATMRGLVDNIATLPGRKLVFFISDGFFIDRNNSDNFDRLQRLTAAAARSGTVIYSIDARGLAAGLPDASTVVAVDPTGRLSRSVIGEVKASQDALNALASDTGGRGFFNTNSMTSAVTAGLKETSIYYLLAWRPENDEQRNPKFRRIEVSVAGRSDLVVRFRRGFGEPPDSTARRAKEGEEPTRKSPNEEIKSTLRAPYPLTPLPVSVALTYLDSAQYGGTLTTSVKVATGSLAVDRKDASPNAVMDVAGVVLNDQGKSVSSFNKRITMKVSPEPTGKPPEQVFYNHFSLIKPGLYQVRVAAVDVKQGTRGSAHQWIEIPDLVGKELTMSSLVVGERKSESEMEPVDPNSSEPQKPAAIRQVNMNVDRRFARSSYLRFLTFIYNAVTGRAAPQRLADPSSANTITTSTHQTIGADVAVQIQVFRDNEPVITTPLRKVSTEGLKDLQRIPYAADVLLNDLQPGAYVLQVTVIDRLAKASASQKLSFYVD